LQGSSEASRWESDPYFFKWRLIQETFKATSEHFRFKAVTMALQIFMKAQRDTQ